MNRAENIYEFRRVNMHGIKTGPHADPDYEQKYHPGKGGSSGSKAFGLGNGKHRIKTRSLADADPVMTTNSGVGPEPTWLDVYINPTESQMKRLSDPDPDLGYDRTEMRFMTDKVGNLIAWEGTGAFHTQVTDALFGMPAWAADNGGVVDTFSDFVIPAGTFYDGIERLEKEGFWDYPDRERPKILRRRKK